MASINFYLKNPKAKKRSIILLVINFDYQRLKLSTGISVPPKFWNIKGKQVRELMDYPESMDINIRLKEIESSVLSCYKELKESTFEVDLEELRVKASRAIKPGWIETSKKAFWDHFEDFVESKKLESTDIRDYDKALRKHLKATEKHLGHSLSLKMITNSDGRFAHEWHTYLSTMAINSDGYGGLRRNSIGKQNKNLKVFLRWCFKRKITEYADLSAFKTLTEEVEDIYLTENELSNLCALTELNNDEKIVRDLFICGCETGLRISDVSRLNSEHIVEDEIHIRPKKTRNSASSKMLKIPISSRFRSILDRYSNSPPPLSKKIGNNFNKILRDICQQAGITEMIAISQNWNGKLKEFQVQKYTMVSSHTARRTFCTLKYLNGMPVQMIMKLSGHRTEKSFLRYLKLDAKTIAILSKKYFR